MARELKPCGTYPAYVRHIARRQEPCEACREANRIYKASLREVKPKPELRPCGTPAAYNRHLRHGEEACRVCKDGVAAYVAERRAARARAAA